MCTRLFSIKSRANYGVKKAFIPCGKCEECRQSLKNQWSFRLRTELEYCHQRKWHVGFFTLTYNDDFLPHIPVELLRPKSPCPDFNVPCFSRTDVRTFIDNIRKRLNERYSLGNDSRVRYLLACEYGSNTKRPHMHGLICYPSNVPDDVVFQLIKDNWKKGHVFPRYITGGVDSHGYRHKPFVIKGDVAGAAVYAAKYCCKDLDFYESLKDYDLDYKSKAVKDCMPFHIQSKSIGLQYFQNKDSADLLKALKDGESFLGESKRLPLPLYIRNKILYRPDYHYEPCKCGDWWYDFEYDKWRYKKGEGTHKRVVGRVALDFFTENYKSIFSQKVAYYKSLFTDMKSEDFWTSKKVPCGMSVKLSKIAQRLEVNTGFTAERLAIGYVAYYGVPYEKAKAVPPDFFYLSRYCPSVKWKASHQCVNRTYYDNLHKYIGFLLDGLKFAVTFDKEKRARIAKILDAYNHMR